MVDKTVEVVGALDTNIIPFKAPKGKVVYINPQDVSRVVHDPQKYDNTSPSCLLITKNSDSQIILEDAIDVVNKLNNV